MFKWMRISPLGRRLIVALILLGGVTTAVSSSIIVWIDYQDGIKRYEQTLQQITQSYQESMSSSLWSYDIAQLNLLAQGITNFPGVRYVQINTDYEIVVQQGDAYAPANKKLALNLKHKENGMTYDLGTLRIHQNYDDLYTVLYERALGVIISQLILALTVGLISLLVIHRLVTKRLLKLTHWARTFSLNNLDIAPPIKKIGPHDELGLVVDTINQMRHTLKIDVQLRKEEQAKHERLQNQLSLAVDNAELGFCRYWVSQDRFECNHHFATQLGLAIEDVPHLKRPMEYFYQQLLGEDKEQQIIQIKDLIQGKKVLLHGHYQLNNPSNFFFLEISFQVVNYHQNLPDHILICSLNRTQKYNLQHRLDAAIQDYELRLKEMEASYEHRIKKLREDKNILKRETRRLRIGQQPKHIQALSRLMQIELEHCSTTIPTERLTIWQQFLSLNFYKNLQSLDLSKEFNRCTEEAIATYPITFSNDLPLSLIAEEDHTVFEFLLTLILNQKVLKATQSLNLKIRLIKNELSIVWALNGHFQHINPDDLLEFQLANVICNMRYSGVFEYKKSEDQLILSISAPFRT